MRESRSCPHTTKVFIIFSLDSFLIFLISLATSTIRNMHFFKLRYYQSYFYKNSSTTENIVLKKREVESLHTISELETKETELQKTRHNELLSKSEFQDNNVDNTNQNAEIKQEDIPTNDVLIPPLNMAISHHQNKNEMPHHPPPGEPIFGTIIFDTKDLF